MVERAIVEVPYHWTETKHQWILEQHIRRWIDLKELNGFRLESYPQWRRLKGVALDTFRDVLAAEFGGSAATVYEIVAIFSRPAEVLRLEVPDHIAAQLVQENARFRITD